MDKGGDAALLGRPVVHAPADPCDSDEAVLFVELHLESSIFESVAHNPPLFAGFGRNELEAIDPCRAKVEAGAQGRSTSFHSLVLLQGMCQPISILVPVELDEPGHGRK